MQVADMLLFAQRQNDGAIAALMGIIICFGVVGLALGVVMIIAGWKIFEKAGVTRMGLHRADRQRDGLLSHCRETGMVVSVVHDPLRWPCLRCHDGICICGEIRQIRWLCCWVDTVGPNLLDDSCVRRCSVRRKSLAPPQFGAAVIMTTMKMTNTMAGDRERRDDDEDDRPRRRRSRDDDDE